ncbi:MAG: inositol monophosphatase family protein [Pseudomonadota bacterium]
MSDSLPLRDLCDLAIKAAQEAGQFIQTAATDSIDINFKDAGSSEASQLVTAVDIRSEAIIRERLKVISEEWGIAFVGEESSPILDSIAAERLRADYFWSVDPLDGTLAFVQGRPGYAVSIALVTQSGKPLLGVVYDPVGATLIYAIERGGVYREPPSCGNENISTEALVVFSDASLKTHTQYEAVCKALNDCALNVGLDGVTWVYGNGAVKNACQVVDHSSACYVKLPKEEQGGGSIWDYAATACIAIESGRWASNIHGDPLELNRSESTFMNHQGVLYASNEKIARFLIDAL